MNDLDELYQQVILDHNKNPKNFGILEDFNFHAKGHNPLCGDQITVYLKIKDDIIEDVTFAGNGCAISKASGSIMTTLIKGKSLDNAKKLFGEFHDIVTSDPESEVDFEGLGKLAVFAGVREFPARVKCASLSWHTLKQALENSEETAITE
jgi:nitrogen fixation NifU-like protein